MASIRTLAAVVAIVATGVVGAMVRSGGGTGQGARAPSVPRFWSSFEGGNFGEWGGYNRRFQPDQYPPGAAVIDPLRDGVPRRDGRRVARFRVTLADAEVGRTHAKLIKGWMVGRGEFGTRPPRDVSAVYRAWYYLPKRYRVRGSGWVNIFQWKEPYYRVERGSRVWRSDPLWWITLERGRRRGVRAFLNNWRGEVVAARSFPRGRWVEVRAVLRQRRNITFFVDRKRFATARQRDYPVSPWHRNRSLGWGFGVGNYSGRGGGSARDAVSGPLYVDAIRVEPLR